MQSQLGNHFLHPPATAPLVHLGTGPAIRQAQSSSLGPPAGRKMRVLFFAGIALLAAIALALFLDRNSSSIYGIPSAEAATKLPVISEIPFVRLPRAKRYQVLSLTAPVVTRGGVVPRAAQLDRADLVRELADRQLDGIDMTAHAPKVDHGRVARSR